MAVTYAEFQFPDGSHYSGTCLVGTQTPHGYGTLTTLTSTYIGSWFQGSRTGYGTMCSQASYPGELVQYDGGFKDGYYHGDGTATYMVSPSAMTYDYHISYSGGWFNGQWDGRGMIRYASRTEYEGGVKMGLKDGYGTMTFADGSCHYEGGWKDDKQDGYGVMTYGDGRRYEGGWRMGQKDGFCVEIDVNGQRYEGGVHGDNNTHGYGVKDWMDGTRYDGGWKDGRQHGYGSQTSVGDAYDGGIKDGLRAGFGRGYTAGGVYEGGYKDNYPEGYGTQIYENGCQVRGGWHQGAQVL